MNRFITRSLADLSPATRTAIAYDRNGAVDIAEPQPLFGAMLAECPVPLKWEGGTAFFSFQDVTEAARSKDIISIDPHTGVAMGMGSNEPLIPINVDGEDHRTFRKLIDPLLSARAVASLEPEIRRHADALIDGFISRGEVEFHDEFASLLPATVFLEIFGLPLEDRELLTALKDGCIKTGASDLNEMHRLGVIAGNKLRAYCRAELDRRKAEAAPRDDLIGKFTTFEVDGRRLTEDEIVNIMHLFVIAGLDTVTASLTCITSWFARHPAEQQRVMNDQDLLPTAIEELLRFENPVLAAGPRWAVRDTEIGGCPVKAGEMVQLIWTTANLDPTQFVDPLTVDLERAGNRHIAFASGTHRCLGSHLARLELRVAMDQMHRRLSSYAIKSGDAPEYDHEGVRAAVRLPLVFTPR